MVISEKSVKIFYFVLLGCLLICVITLSVFRIVGVSLQDFLFALIPPCVFREYLGVYCPGCGGVRSVVSLIHGDFLQSFIYHPFVIYAAVMLILFIVISTVSLISKGKVKMPELHPVYIYIGIAVIFIQWIVKLVALFVFGVHIC